MVRQRLTGTIARYYFSYFRIPIFDEENKNNKNKNPLQRRDDGYVVWAKTNGVFLLNTSTISRQNTITINVQAHINNGRRT